MKFRIGDKVRHTIAYDLEVPGTVVDIERESFMPIKVVWPNGKQYSYHEHHLRMVTLTPDMIFKDLLT